MCVLLLEDKRSVLLLEDNRPDPYIIWRLVRVEVEDPNPYVQLRIIVTPGGVALKEFRIELEQERG